MTKRRRCLFCSRTAQPRGLPLCRKHGGHRPISTARRRRHRRRVQWENSQSIWKAQQRRKAKVAKIKSWF